MTIKLQKLNIALVSILTLAFFAFAGVGQAKAGELDVHFSNEPNPMFNAPNFLPGDSASGSASVYNASSSAKDVIVWTTKVSNPVNSEGKKLGDALTISITKHGETTPIYDRSLTNFFTETGNDIHFPLIYNYFLLENNLSAGGTGIYDFNISFDSSAGNEYQKATTGFDLNIGSWQEYLNNTPSEHTYFSAGGGGSAPLLELEITNVKDKNTSYFNSTISWDTNELASTQIIYSKQDQPHVLTNAPALYGYANAYPLPENLNFTYHHQVFLSNLAPCSKYYYRVVSHMQGKADTVSRPEQSFTTACPQQPEQQQGNGNNGQGSGLLARNPINPRVNGTSVGDENDQGTIQDNQGQSEQQGEQVQPEDKKTNFNLMASLASMWDSLGFNACWPNFPWWLFLLFAVYPILKGLDYWNGRRNRSISFSLISLIPIITAIWAYINKYVCLPWWLLLIFLIASILIWLFDRKKSPRRQVSTPRV